MRATLSILVACVAASPTPATGQELDRLFLSVETIGHIPSRLEPIGLGTAKLPLGTLEPFLHEVSFVYGAGISELASEIVMRAGYRFAAGQFPDGSGFGSHDASGYSLASVPLTIGWRMTFLPYRVRPVIGVDGGGAFTRLRYDLVDENPVESDWLWTWELRGVVGVHVDVWEWLVTRLIVEGRYAGGVFMPRGPEYSATGVGIGLAVAASFDRQKASSFAAAEPRDQGGDDGARRQYQRLGEPRLDRAFEFVRQGDEAFERRNYVDAERHYRRAIGIMPRDPETRRNVEAPVRVDWARTLIETGRAAEARDVLDAALAIDPENRRALELSSEL